jgi:hypothetical protein
LNVPSYRLGRLRTDFTNNRYILHELEERLDNLGYPQSEWAQIQPSGTRAIHVEIHKADLEGNLAEGERLPEELRYGVEDQMRKVRAKLGR